MRRVFFLPLALIAFAGAAPAAASVDAGAARWAQRDWAGAVAEWTVPAARGDSAALFNMGQAYRLGRGVPLSRATALQYYRRAADQGHVAATANLGITMWQEGRKSEALGYLRQASDRGDIRAAYVLGVATFTGDGAPRNLALGYAYVLRARNGGLGPAATQAARMATLLTPEDRARGEAAASALAAGRPVAVAFAQTRPPAAVAGAAMADRGRAETLSAEQPAATDEEDAETRAAPARAAVATRPIPQQPGPQQPGPQQPGPQQPGPQQPGPQQPGAAVPAPAAPAPAPVAAAAAANPPQTAPVPPGRIPPAISPAPRPAAPAERRLTEPAERRLTEAAERRPTQRATVAQAAPRAEDPTSWKVQLGAYADERAARIAWATLVSQSAAMLKGQVPVYSERGNLVRLQLGPFAARAEAGALCTRLAAAGRPCFITRG